MVEDHGIAERTLVGGPGPQAPLISPPAAPAARVESASVARSWALTSADLYTCGAMVGDGW